jgi:hypothetical protein
MDKGNPNLQGRYDKLSKFWADSVIEDGLAMITILDVSAYGITPAVKFIEATDENLEQARAILEKLNAKKSEILVEDKKPKIHKVENKLIRSVSGLGALGKK